MISFYCTSRHHVSPQWPSWYL